jgi:hypothetical protein
MYIPRVRGVAFITFVSPLAKLVSAFVRAVASGAHAANHDFELALCT